MVKMNKTKKGFTLIEMVLVIAIIVIISVVVWFSVSEYLGRAQDATSELEAHKSVIESLTAECEAVP